MSARPPTLAGVGLLLTLAAAGPVIAQCPDGTPPPCGPPPAAPLPRSIAVLPFLNRSPDSADAYIAEALPEQIQGRLSRVSALQPKGHAVVMAQWRRTSDPMQAARLLRTAWLVTGTVRRSGRSLMVAAELIQASSGDGVWSATFRRTDDDIATVEEQVAESVAVAIVGRLVPAQASALRHTPTRNAESYRRYLYGRSLMARRTPGEVAAAVRAFAQAVALDPAFAAAWGQLGYARVLQLDWGNEEALSDDSLQALARAAWSWALRLDSSAAEAWLARGSWAIGKDDVAQARAALERAIGLDSANVDAYHMLGYLYSVDCLDLPRVALPLFARVVALDPDFRNGWRHLALSLAHEGRLAEAEAALDTALSRGPWPLASSERAFIRLARREVVGAMADLADWERAESAMPRKPPSVLGLQRAEGDYAVARYRSLFAVAAGDSSGARALKASFESPEGRAVPGHTARLALVDVALGMRDSALNALERMLGEAPSDRVTCGAAQCSRQLDLWRLLNNPLFLPLRGGARFQRLWEETRPRVPWLEGYH